MQSREDSSGNGGGIDIETQHKRGQNTSPLNPVIPEFYIYCLEDTAQQTLRSTGF